MQMTLTLNEDSDVVIIKDAAGDVCATFPKTTTGGLALQLFMAGLTYAKDISIYNETFQRYDIGSLDQLLKDPA